MPPWADDIDTAAPPDPSAGEPDGKEPLATDQQDVAPRGRFRYARRGLGAYARTGDSLELRRALSHYVISGYGGSATMARRMGGTAAVAGRLNGVLQSGQAPDGSVLRDVLLASGRDARAVLDAIVDAASPTNGTLDRESSRGAVRDALCDLLDRFPEADLLALTDPQRDYVVERFAALDVFDRLCLDLRKTIMSKAPDAATGLHRLAQVREFIAEHVSAAFASVRARGDAATSASIVQITSQALRATFVVFEEYRV